MAGERLKDALRVSQKRYAAATREERSMLSDEFCQLSGYHRKYAIALLNRPEEDAADQPRGVREIGDRKLGTVTNGTNLRSSG